MHCIQYISNVWRDNQGYSEIFVIFSHTREKKAAIDIQRTSISGHQSVEPHSTIFIKLCATTVTSLQFTQSSKTRQPKPKKQEEKEKKIVYQTNKPQLCIVSIFDNFNRLQSIVSSISYVLYETSSSRYSYFPLLGSEFSLQ